jgi:non-ribosomal peptide synthetase component F/alpha-ketoglutarate-dependent taurine dioxygenase/acyl carrier protein
MGFGTRPGDVFVSWLPLYHDMGLIGGMLQPIYAGVPLVLMTTQHFLARPARWLEAIHRYDGTLSGGPDFAFRLCTETVRDNLLAELDLSGWRVAFCGSEPVRADTLADFVARFSPAGLRATTVHPCYGLAEATLMVTSNIRGGPYYTLHVDHEELAHGRVVPDPSGTEMVSSGGLLFDDQVRLMDPQTLQPVAQDTVGEIWVRGPSVAHGYWRNPEATAKTFLDLPDGRWLRSGDLAFLHNGGLFITSRAKDVIIIRGQNRYPQDIEKAVEQGVEAVRKGRVAAFPVQVDGRECIGIAAEIGRSVQKKFDPQTLIDAIDRVVSETQQEPASVIALLEPAALPKTTSGKLQRSACRQRLETGELDAYYVYRRPVVGQRPTGQSGAAPRGDTEQRLAAIWSEVFEGVEISRDDVFLAKGGHSLAAVQVVARVRTEFSVELPLSALFAAKPLAHLAAMIDAAPRLAAGIPLQSVQASGPQALSPVQRSLWLAQQLGGEQGQAAYNMVAQLRLCGDLRVDALQAALDDLMQRQTSLRSAFVPGTDGVARVHCVHPVELALPLLDLSGLRDAEQATALAVGEAEAAGQVFDLQRPPLLRTTLVRLNGQEHRLLLSLHHLIGDGWSFGVLVQELGALYQAQLADGEPSLAPLNIQYSDYAAWQNAKAGSAERQREQDFWRDYLHNAPQQLALPTDRLRPATPRTAGASVTFQLGAEHVAGLERLGRAHGASLFMVLRGAFDWLLHRITGQDDFIYGTDIAGRPHAELEKLIGFFVNIVPLRARIDAQQSFSQWLTHVSEDSLAVFEQADLPFEQIVDASGVPRERQRNPLVQALFVLHSMPRGQFAVPGLSAELLAAPAQTSKFDMALFLTPHPQGLTGEWVFATAIFDEARVRCWADAWVDLLGQILATPDQPLAALTLGALQPALAAPASGRSRLEAKRDKLKSFSRQVTPPAAESAVRCTPLNADSEFPLVIEPVSTDLDPCVWASQHREFIEDKLRRHAGLLLRGFGLSTAQDFEAFAEAIQPGLYGGYGDLPKKEGGRNTYRSTPYPERQMILFHNESAHLRRWPRKQWFFCELPSPVGGATPIVDCRAMYRALPAELAETFERKGLLYVRTFTPGFDVDWRDFYKTDERAVVEATCREQGVEFKWLANGGLQTRTPCPAVIRHPYTGEKSFFNQVQLHHDYCLQADVRRDLLGIVGAGNMPRQVYFGDGTPIEDAVMEQLGQLYEACAVRFDWQRGDVVMLDNMLVAHARDPFEGPRRIVVAMGEMTDRSVFDGAAEDTGEHIGQSAGLPV